MARLDLVNSCCDRFPEDLPFFDITMCHRCDIDFFASLRETSFRWVGKFRCAATALYERAQNPSAAGEATHSVTSAGPITVSGSNYSIWVQLQSLPPSGRHPNRLISMTYTTTPSAAQTGYYSPPSTTTQTAEPREYGEGSSSRPSVPSELAPLSPRPSRDRVPSTNHSYSPSERYDPTSAMSVFRAGGSYFSDDPGAGPESNWFHDQRSQSVWGGNASQHGDTTRASADATHGSTAAPDFLSDLASIFSAPAGTEHGGNWFHDQRVHSQWSGATEGNNTSYASAQTSSLATNSSVSSLSEAASQVASRAPGSNAGGRSSSSISNSHHTSSVSSLHALSEAGSGPRPVGRSQSAPQSSTVEWQNRLPSVSSGGYNVSLTGSEQGALAAARDTGRFRVDSIAGSASALGCWSLP